MNLLILESLVDLWPEGLRGSRAPKGATESRTLDAHSNPVGTCSFFLLFLVMGRIFGQKNRGTIYLDIYRNNSDLVQCRVSPVYAWC